MKYLMPVFLLLVILMSACNKDDENTLFTIPIQDIDFAIPPTANPFQVHYFNFDNTPTNTTGIFAANNYTASEGTKIFPQAATMNVLVGNVNYDFIEQMSIRICEAGDLTENCGREIFWRQPVPEGTGNVLDLGASNVDIKEYLLNEKVNIQVKLERLRRNPPQFVETRLQVRFAVQ